MSILARVLALPLAASGLRPLLPLAAARGVGVNRRAAFSAGLGAALGGPAAASANAAAGAKIGYRTTSVSVGGQDVPVSVWYPLADAAGAGPPTAAPYAYRIGLPTLVKAFFGVKPPLPAPRVALAGGGNVVAGAAARSDASGDALLFAHGFLGSRFDCATLCETLCREGFTVVAPDFAESIMGTFDPNEATSRGAIVAATRALLADQAGATRWGIFGHSAGGGSATTEPGPYPLGRCAIAGARPYGGRDPLFVVASAGDGVIPLSRVLDAVPSGVAPASTADALKWTRSGSGALLFDAPLPGERRMPNHISFLDEETNAALTRYVEGALRCCCCLPLLLLLTHASPRYLSPLLPLTRAMKMPVLDFDVYCDAPDSASTGDAYRPAVLEFFARNRAAASGTGS